MITSNHLHLFTDFWSVMSSGAFAVGIALDEVWTTLAIAPAVVKNSGLNVWAFLFKLNAHLLSKQVDVGNL